MRQTTVSRLFDDNLERLRQQLRVAEAAAVEAQRGVRHLRAPPGVN